MQKLPVLQPGDSVEIIAPASGCTDPVLSDLKNLLISWQLKPIVADDIFGPDLLCANSDEQRFKALERALHRPETKAIVCVRGGYGCMRLIPQLAQLPKPPSLKAFVGMSDITALHIFFQQQWQWPTIHASLAQDKFSPESIAAVKTVLFGETIQFQGTPLNAAAKKNQTIDAIIIGGNLCIVHTGIGTEWQINADKKILLLEDVHERGFRIDRMLEHLRQAGILKKTAAIILGDFTGGAEADGSSFVEPVLQRFAESCDFPVVRIKGIGHDTTGFPVLLGMQSQLQLGSEVTLKFS